ncbi:hypothetical protein ABT026_10200 [Streptomyces sp. NPDC002734]|uniref:hypothetical protein n=1 Tax=Streptomyces sp. NPDC002734 TaxID=3154426 RepID=UPI00332D90DF
MAGGRGRKTWRVVLIVLAAVVVAGVWWLWAAAEALEDSTSSHQAPCPEALAFAGGTLPSGATDARCTVQSWMDTYYRADFRMPRADVADWMSHNWPAMETRTEFCHPKSAALCASTDSTGGQAHSLTVTVTHEDADTARVHVEAFTT